ncbi:uncharacterized protein J8A68_000329 [[Candida] subhashii]|uniref:Spc7 kinetochore protein domain-containing protein n=1 Tax=[Candida] subhashii TaxID=561895 RepID=A0A8J5QRA3_9ASCO|nr:uncharacterized protein J8A68_000329 [[Candida] subhashii]KAG7666073.1 hypothetical protein J8A68_000329 [[Candida] subhashii]
MKKSILKDNTLPLPNSNRRVSFAPDVTLHKFDLVSNKRRKTISSNEITSTSSDLGSAIFGTSDGTNKGYLSPVTREFNQNEIGDDHDLSNGYNEDLSDVSMELTGEIHSLMEVSKQQNSETRQSNSNTSLSNPPIATSDEGKEQTGLLPQPHHFGPEAKIDDEQEITMDITAVFTHTSSGKAESTFDTSIQKLEKSGPQFIKTNEIESVDHISGNEGKQPSANAFAKNSSSSHNPSAKDSETGNNEDEQNKENLPEDSTMTMELTRVLSNIRPNHQGKNLNSNVQHMSRKHLISCPEKGSSNLSNEAFVGKVPTNSQSRSEDCGGDSQPMELTQTIPKITRISESSRMTSFSRYVPGREEDLTPKHSRSSSPSKESHIIYSTSQPSGVLYSDKPEMAESEIVHIESNSEANTSVLGPDLSGLEEQVTTTMIPLAQVSSSNEHFDGNAGRENTEGKEAHIPVTFSQFINDINIQFYDDMDLNMHRLGRFRINNEVDSAELGDYALALPKVELLSLLEFINDELCKSIAEGQKLYSEHCHTIGTSNPPIIREYYEADEDKKISMVHKLHMIRDFTKLNAQRNWYDWRTQLSKTLLTKLNEMQFSNDRAELNQTMDKFKDIKEGLAKSVSGLRQKLCLVSDLKSKVESMNSSRIKELKEQILHSKQKRSLARTALNTKTEELHQSEQTLLLSQEDKSLLEDQLAQAEKQFHDTKRYEFMEINLLNHRLYCLQGLLKLKLNGFSERSIVEFIFDGAISCMFDSKNNELRCSSLENALKTPKLLDVIPRLPALAPCESLIGKFLHFRMQWKWLKQLDLDLSRFAAFYPVHVEIDEQSIQFTIKYYNFEHDYKLQIFGKVSLSKLIKYDVHYGLIVEMKGSKKRLSNALVCKHLLHDLPELSLKGVVIK